MPGPAVALLGVGRWGRNVLRDLEHLGCVVRVVRRDEPYPPGIDGIVIATPSATHAPLAWRALEVGVPVFVEKPLAFDVAEARALAAAGGERLRVMDKWRWHPAIARMQALAAGGALGAVRGLRTSRVVAGNPYPGVDPVTTLALHDVAIALELLGTLPAVTGVSGDGLGTETLTLRARMPGPPWAELEISTAARAAHTRIELVGTRASAVLDGSRAARLQVVDRHGSLLEEHDVRGPDPLLAELSAFSAHLRGGAAPRSSAAEHVQLLERIAELRSRA